MAKKQFYGIKYPFTNDMEEGYFLDLNEEQTDSVKSMICHLIFTPEGQRLRRPTFGTKLLKYIYEPNDSITESDVLAEISDKVALWIPNVTIDKTDVVRDGRNIMVRIDYTLRDGNRYAKDSVTRVL